jgi:hypothetical protein
VLTNAIGSTPETTMNTNTSLLLARDHAAGLLGEADRERLARQARDARQTGEAGTGRKPEARWSLFSLRRSPAASR